MDIEQYKNNPILMNPMNNPRMMNQMNLFNMNQINNPIMMTQINEDIDENSYSYQLMKYTEIINDLKNSFNFLGENQKSLINLIINF